MELWPLALRHAARGKDEAATDTVGSAVSKADPVRGQGHGSQEDLVQPKPGLEVPNGGQQRAMGQQET